MPDVEPVRRTSLIHQVTAALRTEISAGTWPVGQRIPTETQLCELTGAGRNTVREAVQALVHAGLLERRQGSGTYVLADSEMPAALGSLLSSAERQHVMELRLALEVSAAELAATRRTAADLRVLRKAVRDRLRGRENQDPRADAAADVELHRAVVAASGNPVFVEVYESILPTVELLVTDNVSSGRDAGYDADYDEQHEAIVEAIAARDPQAAGAAARALLTEIMRDAASAPVRSRRGA